MPAQPRHIQVSDNQEMAYTYFTYKEDQKGEQLKQSLNNVKILFILPDPDKKGNRIEKILDLNTVFKQDLLSQLESLELFLVHRPHLPTEKTIATITGTIKVEAEYMNVIFNCNYDYQTETVKQCIEMPLRNSTYTKFIDASVLSVHKTQDNRFDIEIEYLAEYEKVYKMYRYSIKEFLDPEGSRINIEVNNTFIEDYSLTEATNLNPTALSIPNHGVRAYYKGQTIKENLRFFEVSTRIGQTRFLYDNRQDGVYISKISPYLVGITLDGRLNYYDDESTNLIIDTSKFASPIEGGKVSYKIFYFNTTSSEFGNITLTVNLLRSELELKSASNLTHTVGTEPRKLRYSDQAVEGTSFTVNYAGATKG